MAYIGNTVQNQGFAPAIDYFNGNGVTVTFTLSRPVASVAQVIVAVDNVIQNPSSAFGVVGNSITFTSAPLSGTNNIWVEYTSLITTYQGISQDPTVIGDIRATGGYLAEGDFGNSFIDGNLIDYVTGRGRFTVGELDDITFYHGGTSARSEMMDLYYAGGAKIYGTTALTIPVGTTAQRPGTPAVGMMRFNTTSGFLEVYDGTEWDSLKTAFVATGGTVSDSDGYRYHTFTSSGNFVVSAGSSAVDILTVAGGGGGGSGGLSGNGGGGGGGAGGYVATSAYIVIPGTYSVTVGAGGTRGTTPSTGVASDGSNSVFGSTTTAIGGGGGRNGSGAAPGNNGGSGGGGSDGGNGGSGTAGQGNAAGTSSGASPARGGGGGGGFGSAGGNGTSSVGGNGGSGGNWQSLGNFYAGGGGAGCESGYTAGTGGSGGGGNGGNGSSGTGQDATANRGSGGGGGGYIGANGGNGSSGVVIVRYAI